MRTMPIVCRGVVATLVILVGSGCSDVPAPEGTPGGGSGRSRRRRRRGEWRHGTGGTATGGTATGGTRRVAPTGGTARAARPVARAAAAPASGATSGAGGTSGSAGNATGGAPAGGSGGSGAACGCTPRVGSCTVFPHDDHWNRDISAAAPDRMWTDRIHALVGNVDIHPDYGVDGSTLYGIPINVVPASQASVPVIFDWYEDESDPGPYPFPGPSQISIEGQSPMACDGDCHVIVVQEGSCTLFEGYACEYQNNGWHCGNGAKWDLTRTSYGQRPEGWTSADAAGLPIMPGLVRYAEVRAGAINHAIRFTLPCTRPNYVAPGTHYAVPPSCDENDPNAPPMGIRMRLRSDFNDSSFPASARVVHDRHEALRHHPRRQRLELLLPGRREPRLDRRRHRAAQRHPRVRLRSGRSPAARAVTTRALEWRVALVRSSEGVMAKFSARLSILIALIFLVSCDHATKGVAKAELEGGSARQLIRGALDFRYVENTDIAFNLLRWIPETIRTPGLLFFGALALLALGLLLLKGRGEPRMHRLALVLVTAGAIGNYLDRVVRGYVVDFVHIHHWPVFNVADVYITAGYILLAFGFFVYRRSGRVPEPGSG